MRRNIQVLDVSHRKKEPHTLHILRKKGQDAILFVHFLSPVTIYLEGIANNVVRNACIIYTPGVCHDYKATTGFSGFENNYVTFKTDTAAFLANYNIPLNEPFYIQNEEEITSCVEFITWASANRLVSLEIEIAERVHELFTLVEKGMLKKDSKSLREAQTRQRFVTLRGEVRLNPIGWSVEKMAAACWLTRSRFYVLYKMFFGITPSEDLAVAVLEYAKERLLHSSDSVACISADCGYKRVESFIRMFNDREGITPGQYRREREQR